MKASEVHKMSDEELREENRRLRQRLFELRAAAVTEKLENPRELRHLRRDIARIETEQRQRQLPEEAAHE
ncbi:MAG: 50S ribosomal protein L29 [Phycisphaeraceae bacterium]